MRTFDQSVLQHTAVYLQTREEQEHSFETQKEMYTDMIMMKPNWQMAGIYADEGITGTIAKKRPDFMRMIEDCRKGKIDMVITKSVFPGSQETISTVCSMCAN